MQQNPLDFLKGLEDRENALKRRLTQVLRKIPKKPSLLSVALAGPISLLVDAHHLRGWYNLALAVSKATAERNPSAPDPWVAFTKALISLNQIDAARQTLRIARKCYVATDTGQKTTISPEFLYLRALLTRNDRKALEIVLLACEADPTYPEALFLAGRLATKANLPVGDKIIQKIGPLMADSPQHALYTTITKKNKGN